MSGDRAEHAELLIEYLSELVKLECTRPTEEIADRIRRTCDMIERVLEVNGENDSR